MPSVLITGSSGFVGRALVDRFLQADWVVQGLARRPTHQTHYVQLDLVNCHQHRIDQLVSGYDVIIHAAARSSPWGSKRTFEAANIGVTEKIIRACENAGKPKLIFVSSSSVYYQPADQFNIDEATPQAPVPINHYAWSKQLAEQRVRAYAGNSVIVRPRAVYGRGDSVLFPRILAAAKAGRLPLLTRSGSPAIGDLIAIDNLVEYIFTIANRSDITGEFNLTDNHSVEILSFLLEIFDRLGIQTPRRKVSVRTAFRFARVLEMVYGTFVPWIEPPITRFGVHVFAFSKTFDVSKAISELGVPKVSTPQAVDDFVHWIHTESPYDPC